MVIMEFSINFVLDSYLIHQAPESLKAIQQIDPKEFDVLYNSTDENGKEMLLRKINSVIDRMKSDINEIKKTWDVLR